MFIILTKSSIIPPALLLLHEFVVSLIYICWIISYFCLMFIWAFFGSNFLRLAMSSRISLAVIFRLRPLKLSPVVGAACCSFVVVVVIFGAALVMSATVLLANDFWFLLGVVVLLVVSVVESLITVLTAPTSSTLLLLLFTLLFIPANLLFSVGGGDAWSSSESAMEPRLEPPLELLVVPSGELDFPLSALPLWFFLARSYETWALFAFVWQAKLINSGKKKKKK